MPSVPGRERLGRYTGQPWERQAGETALQYSRFVGYATVRPAKARSFTGAAEAAGVHESTVREAAERWRWKERAALWDAHEQTEQRAEIAHRETQLASRAINLALVGASILGRSLRALAEQTDFVVDPKDMQGWAKMIETLRKVAVDTPENTGTLTIPAGSALVLPDFAGLTESQVRDRSTEMAHSVLRLVGGRRDPA